MSNTNNSNARSSRASRKRSRPPATSGSATEPQAKKQKSAGQKRRQRNRRAQRDGRALSTRGEDERALAGQDRTANRSGYGNKASMPIWESEYIAEIQPTAAPGFSLQQFPVNPGQAATFPWLANIAKNFEKYDFEFLDFVYKREVSEFATNGQTGKVIMSFDSDATDPPPTTKQQMEDTDPHADDMPCRNQRLRIPRSILNKLRDAFFVRPGPQPANTDLKTFDIGVLNVACQGTTANTVVGELHVEYALRLRIPVLDAANQGNGVLIAAGGSVANATPFGAAPLATGNIVLAAAATNVLAISGLAVGQEIQVTVAVNGTTISAVNLSTPLGMTLKSALVTNAFNSTANQGAATSTYVATAGNASIVVGTTAVAYTNVEAVVTLLTPTASL